MNRNECLERINNLIPDENLRRFIFNSENLRERSFLTDKSNILLYLSNILVLSFGMVFTRFIEWKEKKKEKENFDDFTNSMIRNYNCLDRAYDGVNMSYEFIDTFMHNLQVDSSLHSDVNMNFLKKFNFDNDYFRFSEKFSKIMYEIQKKRISTKYINDEIGYDYLVTFLLMFPYLSRIKLCFKPIENIYINEVKKTSLFNLIIQLNDGNREKIYDEYLNLKYFIINDGLSNYFLEKINIQDKKFKSNQIEKHQIINLDYIEVNWTKRIELAITNFENLLVQINRKYIYVSDTGVEDFLIYFDITKYRVDNPTDNYFFKDFYSFNNIYLKNFALIVSDCLNMKIRQSIIDVYQEKYGKIFELLKVDSLSGHSFYMCNYDWDAVLTILFLEEGISKVLTKIISINDIYQEIVQKFFMRFFDSRTYISSKTQLMVKNPTYNLLPSDLNSKRKETGCKVNALIKLATELLTCNKIKYSSDLLPSNINFRMENLVNVFESRRSINEKMNYFIETTLHTTKMLMVFYESFLEYARVINDLDFQIKINTIFIDKAEIDLVKKKAVANFIREVITRKKIYANSDFVLDYSQEKGFIEYAESAITNIFDKLAELNKKCNNPNSNENKILRKALGQNFLIEEEDLALIINKFSLYFNSIKNEANSDEEKISRLYKITYDYLHYLQCGTFDHDDGYIINKAIYPLIGRYNNSIVSGDGYLSAYFTIDMPREQEKRVKVLSDDSFEFGEEYFCMPNINRIAKLSKNDEELWVSPIILNYKHFSHNYFAMYYRDNHNEKDYPKISELIYNTDPYIYSALFGDIENAKKVLQILFKMPRSMFSIDKYVIVKQDEEVIAVGSIYNKETYWDQNIILSAMKQAEIEVPISFNKACEYFKDTYNDTSGKDKSLICDICVDEKYRNKGVGKFLLTNIIKTTKINSRDLIITVYANNYPAINLYKSLDFIEYERFLDDRGYNRPQEVCIKMIRFSNI